MVRQIGLTIVSFLVLLGLQFAQAGEGPYDLDGRFGFGVGAGFHNTLGSENLQDFADETYGASAWFRYHMSTAWSLDLAYDNLDYDKKSPGLGQEINNKHINLSVGYRAWATKRSRLLIQLGIGLFQPEPSGFAIKEDALGAKFRLAYELMLARDWAFNVIADYHYADVNAKGFYDSPDIQILSPMVGLTYYFGSGVSKPADSDADGVTDDKDKCPGTLAKTEIGADGCAVKKEVAIVDADYDGIPDADDKCPASKMGVKVNAFGCAAEEKLEFKLDVKFASGKSEVTEENKAALAEFAEFMTKYPNTKAEIAGYTDSMGKESFNNFISQKRADGVRSYLIKNFGISADRLTAKGYGPSEPIADNKTSDGRRQNRRVVANIQTAG